MTTPGGVPNLPVGALTLETLAFNLQDMSGNAMKTRAVGRFPSIMDGSTGLSPVSDLTPFGILTRIFAEVQSLIANADPADINGPEDIPQLLIDFIEGIPVVGKFVDLIEAIVGNYEGDDAVLNAIQDIFAPIRKLLQMIAGIGTGFPTPEQIVAIPQDIVGGLTDALDDLGSGIGAVINDLDDVIDDLDDGFKAIFNGWFGGGGTGTPAEVTYTIEAIKDAVTNGYTVVTKVSDEAGWVVPAHAEFIVVMTGGGQSGSGSNGGLHGSYSATTLDLTGIVALDIQVATAGNVSVIRQAAGTAHTGPVLAQSPIHGGPGGIATAFGFTPTTSLPGSGGNAGVSGAGPTAGTPGGSTALAAGGAGGGGGFSGSNGQPGGSVSAGALVKCGGAGGGGGGGASGAVGSGGDGGAGGYPGGGGGGRALGWSGGPAGTVGPGAPGVVWLFYR